MVSKLTKNSEHCSLFLVVAALGLLLLTACQPVSGEQVYTLSGPIMGTDYRVTVVANENLDLEDIQQGISAQLEAVNQSMSNWLPESEVSRFNQLPSGDVMTISASLRAVIAAALQVWQQSDGAFDITLGPVVNAWGFGPDGRIRQRPTETQLAALRGRVGSEKVVLRSAGLSKAVEGVSIDLSAIAKGYAVDRVSDWLRSQGLQRHLVDVGGEIRAAGLNPQQQPWRVGIEKPQLLGGIQAIVELGDMAVATSGDYRNFIMLDGQKYAHTIDPRTLQPALHKLVSVSVMHSSAMHADALATALLSMGEVAAEAFARQQGLAVYMLVQTDNAQQYRVIQTQNFTLARQ